MVGLKGHWRYKVNVKYISFYTEGHYEKVAKKYIIPSFKKWNLDYKVYIKPNLKNWVLNIRQKIDVIAEALKEFPDHDIVWIDADGKIVTEPKLFETIPDEYDIALHYLSWTNHYGYKEDKKELLTGTVYFKNSPKVTDLVTKWKIETVKYNWEQRALEELLKTENINVYELPWSYCFISTMPNGEPPAFSLENPVIVHYQESRMVKKNKGLLK